MIEVQQPDFPAQITLANHGDKDWLESVHVKSQTQAKIVSAKMGWAYVLASGLEFHAAMCLPRAVAWRQAVRFRFLRRVWLHERMPRACWRLWRR